MFTAIQATLAAWMTHTVEAAFTRMYGGAALYCASRPDFPGIDVPSLINVHIFNDKIVKDN